jgi:chromosome segregation ATPase
MTADPFDTVRAGLVVGRSFGDAEAYRALASIEERLKRVETAFDSLTANYEDERARAEAAEQRVAELEEALREIMEKGAYDADYEIARAALASVIERTVYDGI